MSSPPASPAAPIPPPRTGEGLGVLSGARPVSGGAAAQQREQARARRRSIAWDLVMVQLALVNLCLLLFDFTYLRFRTFYLSRAGVVVRLYDPVKGVEPNPLLERYAELAAELGKTRAAGERTALLAELRRFGRQIAENQPFARVGQQADSRIFDLRLRGFVAQRDGLDAAALTTNQALDLLWSPDGDAELATTLQFFARELEPILEVNYYRALDANGEFVDHGWLIDLPFLLLFSIEFYSQWYVAHRRRRYTEWWIYPLVHWYDFLGIMPLPQFRIFRLFRIGSLYVRLRRSKLSSIGDDFVSRAVSQVARMVTEEVTGRVAVRILSASQEALAGGIQARITRAVLEPRRDLLIRELAAAVERAISDAATQANARHLLDQALEQASTSADSLRNLPLPRAVVEPIVVAVGRAVFDSIFQTLGATLRDEEGRAALDALLAEVVDSLIEEFTSGTGEKLLREALVETLDHVKSEVAVRDWTESRPADG